jgi:hypothetical protein
MHESVFEPYEINLSGVMLTVYPMYDGTYDVFQATEKIVTLFPDLTAVGVIWKPIGSISYDYTCKIGDLINMKEL